LYDVRSDAVYQLAFCLKGEGHVADIEELDTVGRYYTILVHSIGYLNYTITVGVTVACMSFLSQ